MRKLIKTGSAFVVGAMLASAPALAQELMIADVLKQAADGGLCSGTDVPTNAFTLPSGQIGVTCSPEGTAPVANGPVVAQATGFAPALGAASMAGAAAAAGLTLIAVVSGGGTNSTTGTVSTN